MSNLSETPTPDLSRVAQDLQLRKVQVEAVVQLMDEGNTPSFVARYRKDRASGLDEDRLRVIRDRVAELRQLADRKATILKAIDAQGKLNEDIQQAIAIAETNKRLDDLYLPYKPKKRSAAADAREKGLEELARAIWVNDPAVANLPEVVAGVVNPDKGLNSPDDVLAGTKLILTETIADTADVRAPVRFALWDTGRVTSKRAEPKPPKGGPPPQAAPTPTPPAEGAPAEAAPTPAPEVPPANAPPGRPRHRDDRKSEEYRDFFEFTEGVRAIPPHRILAINRGEKEHFLHVKLDWDVNRIRQAARAHINLSNHPHRDLLDPLVDDALSNFVLPSLEREIRKELTEEALTHAIEIFARNFSSLLLTPPIRNARVLALDPGTKAGCKAVALDERGTPLEDVTTFPFQPTNQVAEAKVALLGLIRKHNLSVVAIGNGSMCRDMEQIVSDMIAELEAPTDGQPAMPGVSYIIANEAGAADYSDSPIAREEFPNVDRMTRGTISIGRRLQDPLSELVKIDPQHVGVGLYQHDLKPKHLKESIDEVIEACVNEVGVDLNHASAALFRYVSGLNPVIAQQIVQYRAANGPFKSRAQLLQVPGITEAIYTQTAAFVRVYGGEEPLDATWVHPESYTLAKQVLGEAGLTPLDLATQLPTVREKLVQNPPGPLAEKFGTTEGAIRDVVAILCDPVYDPRDQRTPPVLKRKILQLEDLTPGMELKGTVVNVVPFGAFVDVGLKDTGLVHVSRLANKFVKNSYEIVAVGDIVPVWVVEVDNERKRASLTMVAPGQERKPAPRPAFQAPPPRPPREQREPREPRRDDRRDRPPPRQDQPRPYRPPVDRPLAGPPPARANQDRSARFQKTKLTTPLPPDNPPPMIAPQQPGEPPRRPGKPKALPKLSTDALAGKLPLGSFAELEAFFKVKDEPTPPPKPAEAPKPAADTPSPEPDSPKVEEKPATEQVAELSPS